MLNTKIVNAQQKPSSLFVGRFQPFHDGHKKLIESVLKQGKPVVIAIRDTDISHSNPYTLQERWSMIQKSLIQYEDLVKIVTIPDIDEICYGREVGYTIRKIDLDLKIEKISGTSIRNVNPPTNYILWLTGQSGAGKTTLATVLSKKIGAVILDGDEMRETISTELGFSQSDREVHNLRVSRLAKMLSKRDPVIVSVIAPFEATRQKIDALIKPYWIYVKRDIKSTSERPYEEPSSPHVIVNSDNQNTDEQVKEIISFLKENNVIDTNID
ncbi:MAG: adenylyl-sulfate kinase [Candidatus Roizmanbacteria bacterium]|nr:adenylyl-sulfate kinase [Candidatus Roizmanbacteria bacterium]